MELIHSDGSTEQTKLPDDREKMLGFLQAKVGGLIQFIQFSDGRQMVVNEEGMMLELDPNLKATEIVKQDAPQYYYPGTLIAGDVLLLSPDEVRKLQ